MYIYYMYIYIYIHIISIATSLLHHDVRRTLAVMLYCVRVSVRLPKHECTSIYRYLYIYGDIGFQVIHIRVCVCACVRV